MKLPTFTHLVYATFYGVFAVFLAGCGIQDSSQRAPMVQFQTITGQQFDMSALKGSVTLVNFWATSCTTCVHEMPMLVDTFNKHRDKGYRTIAVAMEYDEPSFINHFVKERALPFDVVHDKTGAIAQAFSQVKLTPTSYLLDKQGQIVKRYVGAPKAQEFNAAIEMLLAQK